MEPLKNASNSMKASAADQTSPVAKAVEFAHLIGRLKTTPRTGWVRRGVPRYESVADHSWRVAALAMLLHGRDDLDAAKCMQLAVVHDLAECVVGDIAPEDNVSKEDKQRFEQEAVSRIAALLRQTQESELCCMPSSAATYLLELFHEYEKRQSKEAIAAKDLDLLDMILQAEEYEQTFGTDLSDFFVSTPPSRFRDPFLKRIATKVHEQRLERHRRGKAGNVEECNAISLSDAAFISEYGKASNLEPSSIKEVVKALRAWESREIQL
jgi:putative hydrolases of HD superfamily